MTHFPNPFTPGAVYRTTDALALFCAGVLVDVMLKTTLANWFLPFSRRQVRPKLIPHGLKARHILTSRNCKNAISYLAWQVFPTLTSAP